jgi:hypothetical protein
VIKSRGVRWAAYVAHMGRREMYTNFNLETFKLRYYFRGLGVDVRLILNIKTMEIMIEGVHWIKLVKEKVRYNRRSSFYII